MTEYITVADVDQILGTGWEGSGDKALAVEQANAYLNTLTFKTWEAQPDSVTRAGAELAKEAAAGNLFADSEGALKRKRVKADTVESEKEYQDGAVARSGALRFVDALLSPWVVKRTATAILARL
mgnify:CR=1 FL=1|tara:strand:- start:1557 stop:1931 length:375 start_codon:yes stop_codon:yes gene_type:complete